MSRIDAAQQVSEPTPVVDEDYAAMLAAGVIDEDQVPTVLAASNEDQEWLPKEGE